MTSNIFSILNTAKAGLLSQQLGIEVVGHNIANVQTEGFTRQEVNFSTARPRQTGLGLLGTGVRVDSITRDFDKFLFNQILGEGSSTGNFGVRSDLFKTIEILFNTTTGRNLSGDLDDLFLAFDDLAINPSGLAERTTVVANAETLTSNFNLLGKNLFQERINADLSVNDTVSEINFLLDKIASLNSSIHSIETGLSPANDLRDKRDLAVLDLSKKLDIKIIDTKNNQVSITLANGTPLVIGLNTFQLSTTPGPDNKGFKDILISDGASGTTNITNQLEGGELRGLIDVRDVELVDFIDQVDRLAASLITEFNAIHQLGVGLDGSTGINFFTPLTPTVNPSSLNTGTGVVTMTNASPSTVLVDKFQMQFTSATDFDLINLTTGVNTGSFTFVPGAAFNVAGGLSVTITGVPVAGDIVDFSVSENAASTMSVASAVLANTDKIAAGLSTTSDGDNALALSNLQDKLVFGGNTTFDGFFNSTVSLVGVRTRSANDGLEQQDELMLELENQRQSVSGVSIDEEMINLIKFQQAFEASARMITVVEEMFDVLQNSI